MAKITEHTNLAPRRSTSNDWANDLSAVRFEQSHRLAPEHFDARFSRYVESYNWERNFQERWLRERFLNSVDGRNLDDKARTQELWRALRQVRIFLDDDAPVDRVQGAFDDLHATFPVIGKISGEQQHYLARLIVDGKSALFERMHRYASCAHVERVDDDVHAYERIARLADHRVGEEERVALHAVQRLARHNSLAEQLGNPEILQNRERREAIRRSAIQCGYELTDEQSKSLERMDRIDRVLHAVAHELTTVGNPIFMRFLVQQADQLLHEASAEGLDIEGGPFVQFERQRNQVKRLAESDHDFGLSDSMDFYAEYGPLEEAGPYAPRLQSIRTLFEQSHTYPLTRLSFSPEVVLRHIVTESPGALEQLETLCRHPDDSLNVEYDQFLSSYRTETTVGLAQRMVDDNDFRAMPILADALQEAGCENEDTLLMCRETPADAFSPDCWLLRALLDRR